MSATTVIGDFLTLANFSPLLLAELNALLANYTETGREFAYSILATDIDTMPFIAGMSGPNGAIITYSIGYLMWQPIGTSGYAVSSPSTGVGGFFPVLTGVNGRGDYSEPTQALLRILNRGFFTDGPAAHPGFYPTPEQLNRAVAPQLIPANLR